jgi:hypothetical protein
MSLRVSTSSPPTCACSGLIYGRRAQELLESSEYSLVGQPTCVALAIRNQSLWEWHAILGSDQHIGRLDVAVDDTFLVRVLHGAADLDEQVQALAVSELLLLAVIGDLDATHQLHHEDRAALSP